MGTLIQDLRYGLRMLGRNPGFTVVAVVTLALGIGANTAIFTMLNAVLLNALPVRDPQQLVVLTDPNEQGMWHGDEHGNRSLLTYPEFQDLAARNRVLSGVLAAQSNLPSLPATVEGEGPIQNDGTSNARVSMVSGSYFAVLGVNAMLGRAFTTEVDRARDANPVAVISYNFWQSRFAGDRGVLGRKIRIRQTSFDIIGVAPPHFFGITVGYSPDVWVPLTMQSEIIPGEDWLSPEENPINKRMWLQVMGRLKPGVSVAQAKAGLELTFQQYLQSQIGSGMSANDRKEFLNQHLDVVAGAKGGSTLRDRFAKPLEILMGVVGLVLLIACANLANLLLARAASRQKEIAIRAALGARSARLFRQVVTESVLLAWLGGAFGLLLAQWAVALLLRLVSGGPAPIPLDIHLDVSILSFTLGVALLTGILFSLAPAFRAGHVDLNWTLKGTSQAVVGGTAQPGRLPIAKILVVAQVALSLAVLVVAGLFLRSFQKLSQVELGYDRDHLLLFHVDHVPEGFKGAAVSALYKQLLDSIRAIPGVRGVSVSKNGLFSGSESQDPISIDAYAPKSGQEMQARFDQVGPNYFTTVGIPILMGRDILPEDEANGQRVGLINQTMARYYFGNDNPIGRRIWDTFPTNRGDFVVVGIVADAKYNNLREKTPRRFYLPFFHSIVEPSRGTVEIRLAGDPSSVVGAVRAAVKRVAPKLPPVELHTMNELVSESLTQDRMITELSGFFGLLAVLLACIGIYGLMAYAVARRTNEFGIRMALGAQRADVLKLVLGQGLRLTLGGVAIGIVAALGLTRFLASLLYGVEPTHPTTFITVSLILTAAALLASYIPARRATKVDPIVALRYE